MRKTILTIRTEPELRAALEERARREGRTVSEMARTILRKALDDRPMGERVGHLAGSLKLERDSDDPWIRQMRERNWRE